MTRRRLPERECDPSAKTGYCGRIAGQHRGSADAAEAPHCKWSARRIDKRVRLGDIAIRQLVTAGDALVQRISVAPPSQNIIVRLVGSDDAHVQALRGYKQVTSSQKRSGGPETVSDQDRRQVSAILRKENKAASRAEERVFDKPAPQCAPRGQGVPPARARIAARKLRGKPGREKGSSRRLSVHVQSADNTVIADCKFNSVANRQPPRSTNAEQNRRQCRVRPDGVAPHVDSSLDSAAARMAVKYASQPADHNTLVTRPMRDPPRPSGKSRT